MVTKMKFKYILYKGTKQCENIRSGMEKGREMDIYFAEGIGGRGIGSYCRVWRDRPHVPALLPLLTFPPMHSPPSPLILVSIRPVPLTRTINPSEIPPPDRATKP